MKKLIFAASAAVVASLTAGAAGAESVADVYKDRTVTILVGYGAGGTYGQTSLLLSRHLKNFIPGHPNVIVQHMPGAGGIKMTNYAYNAAPKTGHYIMMPPEMILVSQLLRPKRVKYKANKFTWMGTVFQANQVMTVRRDTGIKSIKDLTKREVIIASTGTGSPTFLVPSMMNGILKTKFKIVTGYKGSAKTTLAVEQGEAMGMTNSWVSWKKNRPQWFTDGDKSFLLKLCQVGYHKEPGLEHLPLLTELAKSPDDKAAAALLSTASVISRGLALLPGTPHKLVKPMQDAFWKTVTNPAFVKDATSRNLPVSPLKGDEINKVVAKVLQMSPTAVKNARQFVFGKKK